MVRPPDAPRRTWIESLRHGHRQAAIFTEDYLQGELASEVRHEYVAGNVYAMSGGTLNHLRVAVDFILTLETYILPEAGVTIPLSELYRDVD